MVVLPKVTHILRVYSPGTHPQAGGLPHRAMQFVLMTMQSEPDSRKTV